MILDQYNEGLVMEEKDTSNQYLYNLTIDAGTLAVGNKIRLKATIHIAQAIPPNCDPCAATANPGEQTLSIIHDYDYTLGIPQGTLTGNVAGQVNYVANLGNKEEFIATVANRSGFATSYDYPHEIGDRFNNSNWQLVHFIGTRGERVDPVTLPLDHEAAFFSQDAQSGHPGHSDEFSYLIDQFIINTPLPETAYLAYFDYDDDEVTLMGRVSGAPLSWAKYGDELFGTTTTTGIVKWPVVNGGVGVTYPAGGKAYLEVFATANYLWGLTSSEIVQLRKDNVEIIATYDISGITSPTSFHIIDERAAYIGTSGRGIYYMLFTEEVPYLIGTYPSGSAAGGLMHYTNGYFYFVPHNPDFGSGYTGLLKVGPLLCPGTEIALG